MNAMAYFHFDSPAALDRFCVEGVTGLDGRGRPTARGGVLVHQDPEPPPVVNGLPVRFIDLAHPPAHRVAATPPEGAS